jgi:hypothetical protein
MILNASERLPDGKFLRRGRVCGVEADDDRFEQVDAVLVIFQHGAHVLVAVERRAGAGALDMENRAGREKQQRQRHQLKIAPRGLFSLAHNVGKPAVTHISRHGSRQAQSPARRNGLPSGAIL